VNKGFNYSPQTVTKTFDPAAASAAMGPYYPTIKTCPLATLIQNGMSGCK
jgi:hypothetical protein